MSEAAQRPCVLHIDRQIERFTEVQRPWKDFSLVGKMNLKFRMLLMYATFFQFLDRTMLDPILSMAHRVTSRQRARMQ